MANEPTARQQEVFNFIVAYLEERGYPPSIREMMEGIGIRSLRGVTIHLDALEKKGMIERLGGKDSLSRQARGIRILAHLKPRSLDEVNGVLRLPLLGTIAAGTPLLANQNIEDVIAVPLQILHGAQDSFLLRVKGESMSEGHILDGDIVVIKPQASAENGEIVAARIGEEATVKRFWRNGSQIELQPQNPDFQPIRLSEIDGAVVIGKVIGLLRGY
jgi:repressor LexA